MKPGYSQLIINELVIPSTGTNAYAMTADLAIAAIHNNEERSEEEWRAFLESTGFKIVKIWQKPGALRAVIQAELA